MTGRDQSEIQIDSLLGDVKIMTRGRSGEISLFHANGSTTRIGLARARDGQTVDLRVKLGEAPSVALMNGSREEMRTWLEYVASTATTNLRRGAPSPVLRITGPGGSDTSSSDMDADFVGVAPRSFSLGSILGARLASRLTIAGAVAGVVALVALHSFPLLKNAGFDVSQPAIASNTNVALQAHDAQDSAPPPAPNTPPVALPDQTAAGVVALTAEQVGRAPRDSWGTPSVHRTAFWMKPGTHAYLPMPGGGTVTTPAGLAAFGLGE